MTIKTMLVAVLYVLRLNRWEFVFGKVSSNRKTKGSPFRPLFFLRLSGSTVCIFGDHAANPNRSAVMTFNSNREEAMVAETDYRILCSTVCINGEFRIDSGVSLPTK